VARRHRILITVLLAAGLLAAVMAVALSRSVKQSEYDQADARLAAELGGAVRAVEGLGEEARARAVRLAASLEVQRAFARNDIDRLRQIAAGSPGVASRAANAISRKPRRRHLPPPRPSSRRARGRPRPRGGTDRRGGGADCARARRPARPRRGGTRAGAAHGRAEDSGTPRSRPGWPGTAHRAAPHGPIAAAVSERRRRVLLAVLASLASVVFLAFLAAGWHGPRRRRLRRTPTSRPPRAAHGARERDLVGNVLAAGHDVDALPPVILDSAVAVTGAVALVSSPMARCWRDRLDERGQRRSIALSGGAMTGGLSSLPAASGFDDDDVQLAEWLAGRARSRPERPSPPGHRQLASTDDLTQLEPSAVRRGPRRRGRPRRAFP
jgi:hypothetical protein